ncbi:hypothetical protein AB0E88_34855 [Streptomyces sp. NPDC028635]
MTIDEDSGDYRIECLRPEPDAHPAAPPSQRHAPRPAEHHRP